jgi:hypothetical protein
MNSYNKEVYLYAYNDQQIKFNKKWELGFMVSQHNNAWSYIQ